jgi:beta-lactamase regulating signal transducer with metallopeptidase domain
VEVIIVRRAAPPPAEAAPAEPEPLPAPAPEAQAPPPDPAWHWGWAAAAVWAAGALVMALKQARQVWRVRRLLAESKPAPTWLNEALAELAGRLGVRPPRAVVVPGLGSPLVWGLGRPCLLWPEGLEEALAPEGCRAVLVHELAHLRRRDHRVAWLVLVGACLWWWHPLYRFVRLRLAREAEEACDSWVVALLPDARRAYAEALLEVCQRRSVPVAPAVGAAGGVRDLKRRLVMVMREPAACRLSGKALLGLVVLALLALPAWELTRAADDSHLRPSTGTGSAPGPKSAPAADPTTGRPSSAAVDPFLAGPKGSTSPTAAKAPPLTETEKKLREMEKQLADLRKQLEALRKAKGLPTAYPSTMPPAHAPANPYGWSGSAFSPSATFGRPPVTSAFAPPAGPNEVALTRATYSLPAGKATALARFLQEHVKAPVLETKVEGERLIVTTTPDKQRAIAQIVGLIRGGSARRTGLYDAPVTEKGP